MADLQHGFGPIWEKLVGGACCETNETQPVRDAQAAASQRQLRRDHESQLTDATSEDLRYGVPTQSAAISSARCRNRQTRIACKIYEDDLRNTSYATIAALRANLQGRSAK
nr:hypothetical protein [Escherichia coli]